MNDQSNKAAELRRRAHKLTRKRYASHLERQLEGSCEVH